MTTPDCASCSALCCLGLAFDRSQLFGFDKAAGVPCRLLDARHGCRIHETRAQRGFAGCVAYDCLGAGQRVTRDVFGGRSWRDDPRLIEPMLEAFRVLREVHELWVLVNAAGRLALTPPQRLQRAGWLRVLEEPCAAASIAAFEREGAATAVLAFLRGLRSVCVPPGSEPHARRLPIVR